METVANIFLKSDTGFEINEISQVPIIFNYNQYNYYLSLLNFSFLNCSPNIYNPASSALNEHEYYLNYNLTTGSDAPVFKENLIPAGLYDNDDIINLMNSYYEFTYVNEQDPDDPLNGTKHQVVTFRIDKFTEKLVINYNAAEANLMNITKIEFVTSTDKPNVLTNNLFRFTDAELPTFTGPNDIVINSSKAFRISTYNNVMLTSSSIPGLTSLKGDDNGITTSSALYVISSVADPYTMIDYTAIQPIDFALQNIPNLTNFQFKLVDENNNDLLLLPNATPDFSIKIAIKRFKIGR